MSTSKNIQTQLLHNDRVAGIQHASSHQPIYKSVQFTYDSAQGIADAFQGKAAGYTTVVTIGGIAAGMVVGTVMAMLTPTMGW